MELIYSNEDYNSIKGQYRRCFWLFIAALVVFFGVGLAIMYTVRMQWLSLVISLVGGMGAIFAWGIYGVPVRRYWKYLNNIQTSRKHEWVGAFLRWEQPALREGVNFIALRFLDNANSERLLYWDQAKAQPAFNEGEKWTLTECEHAIVGLEKA